MRTCQECGQKQEDKQPDRSKELTGGYTERKCKKCKSASLDYGREVAEAADLTIGCENCGTLDYALIDGYHFGDRLLEGVKFRVSIDGGVVTVVTDPAHARYMADLNEAKWLKEAKRYAVQEDTMECPKCGADIDGLGVHDDVEWR